MSNKKQPGEEPAAGSVRLPGGIIQRVKAVYGMRIARGEDATVQGVVVEAILYYLQHGLPERDRSALAQIAKK